jgi:hypothetical protein
VNFDISKDILVWEGGCDDVYSGEILVLIYYSNMVIAVGVQTENKVRYFSFLQLTNVL